MSKQKTYEKECVELRRRVDKLEEEFIMRMHGMYTKTPVVIPDNDCDHELFESARMLLCAVMGKQEKTVIATVEYAYHLADLLHAERERRRAAKNGAQ
jgi:hypothetical protein